MTGLYFSPVNDRKKERKADVYFLTVFAVDFDRVGGQLKRSAAPAGLREPEVLHLTVGAQHVHIQH